MVCFTIIFLSLLECIVVDRLWRAKDDKMKKGRKTGGHMQRTTTTEVEKQEKRLCCCTIKVFNF